MIVRTLGVLGLSSIPIFAIHKIRYGHYLKVRDMLMKDNTEYSVIEIYDEWLSSSYFNQLIKDPSYNKD